MKYRERLLRAAHSMHESQAYPDAELDDRPFLEVADAVIEEIREHAKSEAVSIVEHFDSYVAAKLKEQMK